MIALGTSHFAIPAFQLAKLDQLEGNAKDSVFAFTLERCDHLQRPRGELDAKEQWRVVTTIPPTTSDVGELLSIAHAAEKCKNSQCA